MMAARQAGRDRIDFTGAGRIDARMVWAIAVDGASLAVGDEVYERMRVSERVLAAQLATGRPIYGVTTGYGPEARHHVAGEHSGELQRNLLYHLATGVGAPLRERAVRAMMVARIASLARGYSALGRPAFDALLACLNANVLPVVPEMGTVGASGDLTPLAHLGLLLIGEGTATADGTPMPALEALASAGVAPIELGAKDGIALVNGTAAMTGIAALNGARAGRLWRFALRLGALYAECMNARGQAFDPRFGEARPHAGQRRAHAMLAELLHDGARLRPELDAAAEGELLQDPYSMRCLPQIFGAAYDVLAFHDAIVDAELDSATDNPLVIASDGDVLHGGNFFGQPVGYASDALGLAVINLAVHAERVVALTCDPSRNRGLPAFLRAGPSGRNSGFMGAQVTASALVAELRTLATPTSIQSIPTNADNQDVVPMGTIAARRCDRLLDLTSLVLAIEAIVLADAFDLRVEAAGGASSFSSASRGLVAWLRRYVERLRGDRPLSADISSLAAVLDRAPWDAVPGR